MEFLIDTLEGGEPLLATLEDVGAVYPDDDVIYFFGIPCRLSSARPTPRAVDVATPCAECGQSANWHLSGCKFEFQNRHATNA